MYRVFLERAAERELKRLSARLHDRVIIAIQALAKNPRPAGYRKIVGAENDWRIRVGDYRVVYEIADAIEVAVSTASDTVVKSTAEYCFAFRLKGFICPISKRQLSHAYNLMLSSAC